METRSPARRNPAVSAPAIPEDVLECVLKRIDMQHRLRACALVCERWAAAARQATSSILLGVSDDPFRLKHFLDYLNKHGEHVRRLKLGAAEEEERMAQPALATLPCRNLRELELHNFDLQRAEEPCTNAGALAAVTGLTRLAIKHGMFIPSDAAYSGDEAVPKGTPATAAAAAAAAADAASSFAAIQHLTDLQELDLSVVGALQDEHLGLTFCQSSVLAIPGEGLAALTQLTKLSLVAAAADPRDTLQHISRLTALQDLHLEALPPPGSNDKVAKAAAAAPTFAGIGDLQRLTKLAVHAVPGSLSRQYLEGGAAGQLQGVVRLTSLQHLHLKDVELEAGLLAGLTQLLSLQLSDITWVVSPSAEASSGPAVSTKPPADAGSLGAYQLLQLLPGLQQLRRLQLDLQDWPDAEHQLPAYAALTSNTLLEHLNLQYLQYPLPAAAWKHIFRKELQLPGIAGVMMQGVAPASSSERVLMCCPVVAASLKSGVYEGRLQDGLWEGRWIEDEATPAQVRLLEARDDDPPGLPAVLGALTHLEVVFEGEFHGWGLHGCSEAEWQEGEFGVQSVGGHIIW